LLRLFVLRTVSSEPKSGYDILKEITEKTQGEWHPSKGTIYPILSELDKEGLIETVEEGARARRAFKTTDKGMSHLTEAIKERRPSHRGRMDGRRLLFVETFFDETEREILRLSNSIRRKALSMSRKRKAIKLLKETLRSMDDLEENK
jgi:DNA-binding PadR family transcriptional regulator